MVAVSTFGPVPGAKRVHGGEAAVALGVAQAMEAGLSALAPETGPVDRRRERLLEPAALAARPVERVPAGDLLALLQAGPGALAAAREVAGAGGGQPLDSVQLLAPIRRPGKLLAVAGNFLTPSPRMARHKQPTSGATNRRWG